jgi:hypothetical protein
VDPIRERKELWPTGGIVSRGHVVGQQPLALHTGATVMLDGSCKPRVMQIVFDTMLADVPAMVACPHSSVVRYTDR